jgi:hypothetical protein
MTSCFVYDDDEDMFCEVVYGKKMETKEVVTFIMETREEALFLSNELGGGEIHALHIAKGFQLSEKPVGYLVKPPSECVSND